MASLPTSNSACLANCSHFSVPMTPVLISSDLTGSFSLQIWYLHSTRAIAEIHVNPSFYSICQRAIHVEVISPKDVIGSLSNQRIQYPPSPGFASNPASVSLPEWDVLAAVRRSRLLRFLPETTVVEPPVWRTVPVGAKGYRSFQVSGVVAPMKIEGERGAFQR